MKELTIEEKAKAYDEAIKVARSKIKNDKDHVLYEEDITDIFPVLKESEDEKIRKSLSAYFAKFNPNDMWDADFSFGDIVAWFEKQGEPIGDTDTVDSNEDGLIAATISSKPTGVQPKQEWSEEDKKVTKWVIDYIGNCPNESFDFYGGVGKEAVLSWLNKLKDILQLQPKQKWSEKDEEMRLDAIKYLELFDAQGIHENNAVPCINWLKNLKDRVLPQPKQEWSEEDIGNLLDVKCIIDEVWHSQYAREEIDHSGEELESLWHWLDELWQRVEYPQSTWKPSDMELEVLRLAAEKDGICLMKLYEQLKKLREE